MRRTGPLIIGGGPAGAAAAILLARGGSRPLVIERAAGHDALCGGFLSWTTLAALRACGIDALALGARPVTRARLFSGRRQALFDLPAPAAGLSRRVLDQALLDAAERAGAVVRRGATVRAIADGGVRCADGTVERADHIILATGKHDLRGVARPVTSSDPAVGLRWRFPAEPRLAAALADAIELHLFPGGYAGLVLQEAGHANLCLAARHSRLAGAGNRPNALLAELLSTMPRLAERLSGQSIGPAQAIANVPYGWRAMESADGLYRVGDQAGVIPSIAGEGIGIALDSGMAAARALQAGEDAAHFQPAIARRIARPIRTASLVWHLAERPAAAAALVGAASHVPGLAAGAMRLTRV